MILTQVVFMCTCSRVRSSLGIVEALDLLDLRSILQATKMIGMPGQLAWTSFDH